MGCNRCLSRFVGINREGNAVCRFEAGVFAHILDSTHHFTHSALGE